jgi:hypothetical protein
MASPSTKDRIGFRVYPRGTSAVDAALPAPTLARTYISRAQQFAAARERGESLSMVRSLALRWTLALLGLLALYAVTSCAADQQAPTRAGTNAGEAGNAARELGGGGR